MHLQFLVEDRSGAILIDLLMKKIVSTDSVTYKLRPFSGLGGFTKKNTVKETKTGKLLNDLATYLKGFNKSLSGFPAAILIVLDNDSRNTKDFLKELNNVAVKNHITIDHVFCIAIEELEAWLLGDHAALLAAYPKADKKVLKSYKQDSICGTWEKLADVIYPGGYVQMKKDCKTPYEIGKCKCDWAKEIGTHMNLKKNKSSSFNRFISEICKRIAPTTP